MKREFFLLSKGFKVYPDMESKSRQENLMLLFSNIISGYNKPFWVFDLFYLFIYFFI